MHREGWFPWWMYIFMHPLHVLFLIINFKPHIHDIINTNNTYNNTITENCRNTPYFIFISSNVPMFTLFSLTPLFYPP